MTIHPKHSEWLESRGLDMELAAMLGLETVNDNGAMWLSFPYRHGGREINHKRRMVSRKAFMMDVGAPLLLWNRDVLDEDGLANEALIITEGEPDAMAAMMAGKARVVSVPNGAPGEHEDTEAGLAAPDGGKRYSYLWRDQEKLDAIKAPIILAVDNDAPGLKLAADLARWFGPERCRFVTYPEGCKDLNDVLMRHDAATVTRVLDSAKPYPVKGLYRLSDFPEPPTYNTIKTGITELDYLYSIVPGTLSVWTGYAGQGKALALDTPIPTPQGWTTMGEIVVGDEIFSETGKPCKVTFATDIQLDRRCFRVVFDDGSEIIADGEHRWLTSTVASRMSARNNAKRWAGRNGSVAKRGTDQSSKRILDAVVTTDEIAATLRQGKHLNHKIALTGALECPAASLPLDPYLLGAWLGDGLTSGGVMFSADAPVIQAFADAGFEVRPRAIDKITFSIIGLKAVLRGVGVLNAKHIPDAYMRASIEQRFSLLQGLMDTDGYCGPDRVCEFVATNSVLAEQVHELALSLGLKATLKTGKSTLNGKDCGLKYRVRFISDVPVFRLDRKRDKQGIGLKHRIDGRFIVAVEPVDSVPVRCIQVDAPSHLFLAGRAMVPTHNTSLMMAILASVIKQGHHVCMASFETAVKPILQRKMRAALLGTAEFRCDFDPWADGLLEQRLTIIAQTVDSEDMELDLDMVIDLAKLSVRRDGARVLVIDPWNEIEHKRRSDESETDYIGRAIRALKSFARIHDVAVIVVAHPAKPDMTRKMTPPGLYQISGSANWANKADYGITVHASQPDPDAWIVDVIVTKVRMGLPGKRGDVSLFADWRTSSYVKAGAPKPQGDDE